MNSKLVGLVSFLGLSVLNAQPTRAADIAKAEVNGGGFSWELKPTTKGTQISTRAGRKLTHRFTSAGTCSFEAMFDAPAKPRQDLLTPFIACKTANAVIYVVAKKSVQEVEFSLYSAPGDCVDFTNCAVQPIKKLR
jgi:hypothetical protein